MIINIIKFTITMIIILALMSFISTIMSWRKQRQIAKMVENNSDVNSKRSSANSVNNEPASIQMQNSSDDDLDEEDIYFSYNSVKEDDDIDNDIDKTEDRHKMTLIGDTVTGRTGKSVIDQYTVNTNIGIDAGNKDINIYRDDIYDFSVQKNHIKNQYTVPMNSVQNIPYMNPIINPVQLNTNNGEKKLYF